MKVLNLEAFKRNIEYCPISGYFTWITSHRAGEMAGHTVNGYRKITFEQGVYMAHRVAWFYMTGSWPKDQIDHINRIRSDNRFVNLREATAAQNCFNRSIASNNKSGFKGVSKSTDCNRWVAHICLEGKIRHLGLFKTPEEADAVYRLAQAELHSF